MANEISNSVISSDQEKFLAAKLISRSMLRLVSASVCDPIKQPEGTGLTAYFIRYQRMNVPVASLTEGQTPSNSTFSLQQVTVTLDQWGDVLTLTDIAQLTANHPVMQQAVELLSDNAARVIDREIQLVWLAGTNVQYGDATVTTRATVTTSMKLTDTVITKAVVGLEDAGCPPRGGPSGGIILGGNGGATSFLKGGGTAGIAGNSGDTIRQGQNYVGLAGPQVIGDIRQTSTSLGTWVATAMYQNPNALYNGEVGEWLGVRWVKTNFIPKFVLLGNNTAAVTTANAFGTDTPVVTSSTSGGALATGTYYFKVSRKDLLRGFEEQISIPHTIAVVGTTGSVSFNFSGLTAGYVYNLYFDATSTGGTSADSNIKLVSQNINVGQTITVTAVATGAAAPANPANGVTVHVVYLHGDESTNYVSLQNLQLMMSKAEATTSNPLMLWRTVAYKFMAKAMIRDQTRILRLEVAASY